MKKQTNKMNGVIIDESVYNDPTPSDIKTLINRVDKLTDIIENKTDKLISRLDKITSLYGIN